MLDLHALPIIRKGDTVWTWCSVCMTRTDHRYNDPGLACIRCEEEKKELAEKAKEGAK